MTTHRKAFVATAFVIATAAVACESPEAPPLDSRIAEGTTLVYRAQAIAARIEERGEITDADDIEIHALADDMVAWNERYDGEDFEIRFGTQVDLDAGGGELVNSVDLASGSEQVTGSVVPLAPGGTGSCPDCEGVYNPPGGGEICFLHRVNDCDERGSDCTYWCMRWPRLLPF